MRIVRYFLVVDFYHTLNDDFVLHFWFSLFIAKARNHVAACSCPAGYTGDPFTYCRRADPGIRMNLIYSKVKLSRSV